LSFGAEIASGVTPSQRQLSAMLWFLWRIGINSAQIAGPSTDLSNLSSVAPKADVEWLFDATDLGTRILTILFRGYLRHLKAHSYHS
jgi:hypothetical protein